MTIDEAINKIDNAEPMEISSIWGADILRYLDIDSCDDCHKLALYIVENELVNEIIKQAAWNITCEMGDSLDELIQDGIDMAITQVIGNDKLEELGR